MMRENVNSGFDPTSANENVNKDWYQSQNQTTSPFDLNKEQAYDQEEWRTVKGTKGRSPPKQFSVGADEANNYKEIV